MYSKYVEKTHPLLSSPYYWTYHKNQTNTLNEGKDLMHSEEFNQEEQNKVIKPKLEAKIKDQGAPHMAGELKELMRSGKFNQEEHDKVIKPKLEAMIKDQGFPHMADKNFWQRCDKVYFMSDLHADPARFLDFLYRHDFITLPSIDTEKEKYETYTDFFHRLLSDGDSAAETITKLKWITKDDQKTSALLILGDIIDGARACEVPKLNGGSNEYLLHVLLLHLRLKAHEQTDYIFFCLGNHETLRWEIDIKYNQYMASQDKDYLHNEKSFNLLEDFYRSSPHVFFSFPLAKKDAEEADNVYAAHAELFDPFLNSNLHEHSVNEKTKEEIENNFYKVKNAQKDLFEDSDGSPQLNGTAMKKLEEINVDGTSTGVMWNRGFHTHYHELQKGFSWYYGDKDFSALDMNTWKSNKYHLKHFVAGHSVVHAQPSSDGKTLEGFQHHHSFSKDHSREHVKDLYFFVDRGLSRCFQKKEQGIDWSLLFLDRCAQNPEFEWLSPKKGVVSSLTKKTSVLEEIVALVEEEEIS